jgi:hypothetical protein
MEATDGTWSERIFRLLWRDRIGAGGTSSGQNQGAQDRSHGSGLAERAPERQETATMPRKHKIRSIAGEDYVPTLERVEVVDRDRTLHFYLDTRGEIQRLDIFTPSGVIIEVDPARTDMAEFRILLDTASR